MFVADVGPDGQRDKDCAVGKQADIHPFCLGAVFPFVQREYDTKTCKPVGEPRKATRKLLLLADSLQSVWNLRTEV
jgi:hypothetical protein